MTTITYLNGAPVETGGYWSDRHGHMVLVCAGQRLPACPHYPYENTFWRLATPVACSHDHSPRGPKAA